MGLGANPWELKSQMYDVFVKDTPLKEIVLDTEISDLQLAPCNLDLSGVEPELANQIAKEFILRDRMGELNGYDYVIIDNPPTLGLLTVNCLMASTDLLIPVKCELVRRKAEEIGTDLVFLPLYSPDLNPIEPIWGR